jgi:hypothetical protein
MVALVPFGFFLFMLTFFVGQWFLPFLQISRKGLRLILAVCVLGCVFGVAHSYYEPPDGLDEGLSFVGWSHVFLKKKNLNRCCYCV